MAGAGQPKAPQQPAAALAHAQAQAQTQKQEKDGTPKAPVAAAAPFDRRESGTAQQKNALLSLFGNTAAPLAQAPRPQSNTNTNTNTNLQNQKSPAEFPGSLPLSALPSGTSKPSGIGSPVSPLPSHLAGHGQNGRRGEVEARETPRSSRISSLNSAPGDPLPLPLPISTSAGAGAGTGILGGMPFTSAPAPIGQNPPQGAANQASQSQADTLLNLLRGAPGPSTSAANPLAGVARASPPVRRTAAVEGTGTGGATSPITPVEKSFLLGMLKGVVDKEGEKARSRQGSLR